MARKKGRDISGIILLDKPQGMTSNRALRRVSGLLNARKAGHTGSLDPLATGLLVLCFGEATKVSGRLLDADKSYEAIAQLGVVTDSADADGTVIDTRPVPVLTKADIAGLIERFSGPQQQIPPMYSALKVNGKRLHELARAGEIIEREPRAVTIHALAIEVLAEDRLKLSVRCSKGTYIRSLVADIGEALGCGAHVEALRRTALGPFRQPTMWPLEELEALEDPDEAILPTDTALQDYPSLTLDGPGALAFCQGQRVAVADQKPPLGWVRVYEADGSLLGLGEIESDYGLRPRRLLVQRSSRG